MSKKLFFTILFLLAVLQAEGQNPSYKFIRDSIEPLYSTNYLKAKKLFLNLEKKYEVDPYEKLVFLNSVLENDDVKFFKKEIKVLIKDFGFRYPHFIDTGKQLISDVVRRKGLTVWMCTQSEKLYPQWVQNNPRAFEIQTRINELVVSDQRRVFIFSSDSACADASMSNVYANDLDNYHQLFLLWDQERILPNNFDQGLGTTQKWELILWHLLKSENHEAIWQQFLPHLERMYFAGKIGDAIFRDYDFILATWFGYQYYGFQGEVPVKDAEHLLERREKYGF